MFDSSKRLFCKSYFFQQCHQIVEGFGEGLKNAQESQEFDDFFGSYESSYALTLAYPDDILLDTADQLGIETEGREKNEIVKELFKKHGGYNL